MTDNLVEISIQGLSAIANHGVYQAERETPQPFIADLWIEVQAPRDDDLSQTLDYAAVAKQVVAIMTGEPVNLLETLASRIADAVLGYSQVVAVRVQVHKPHAGLGVAFNDVCVSLTRRKE